MSYRKRYGVTQCWRVWVAVVLLLVTAAAQSPSVATDATAPQRAIGGSSEHPAGKAGTAATVPLVRAHSHNDYEHPRPLFDALECGFCSVEADVYLVDGQLLVAHDRSRTQPGRTLQALYLDPLHERARLNHGRIYPGGPECLLFIDLKSEAESTYATLHRVLSGYSDMLTRFENGKLTTNAVLVIVSGNRPRSTMAAQTLRYAACDGRMPDLDQGVSPALVPVVSDQWSKFFKWRGQGDIPDEDLTRLKQTVAKAHAQGFRLRLWSAPDQPASWQILLDAGVDLINTDNLKGLRDFLLAQPDR